MGGEPSSTHGHAADLERVADALAGRFTVTERLTWGQSVPFYAGSGEIGRIAIAVLPFAVSRDDGTSDAFHDAAFELVELTGRGLLPVYRHGVAGGAPYFAYRMPRGRPLAERMAEGPFTSRAVLRIAESLLEALSIAHRHGVTHGELTPKNILIEERGEKMRVTLIGTGHASVMRAMRGVPLVRPSGFPPSLSSYLAPELLAGEAPTPSTDLYALGALLHHLVCGRPPSGFDTVEAYEDLPSLVEVVRRAREADPTLRYDNALSMRSAIDWVEIESERQNAQTQDIPLWMEMSVVANIPVTELLRGNSIPPSQPPGRASEPPVSETRTEPSMPPSGNSSRRAKSCARAGFGGGWWSSRRPWRADSC